MSAPTTLAAAVIRPATMRCWLAMVAIRNLSFAAALLADRDRFSGTRTFIVVEHVAALQAWAGALIFVGMLASIAVTTLHTRAIRSALVLSAVLSGALAGAFGWALVEAPGASIMIFGLLVSLTVKDLLLCSATLFGRR